MYRVVKGVTKGYRGLKGWVRGVQGVTRGIQEVTGDYSWLQGATSDYRGYWELQVGFYLFWNYSLLFCTLFTKHFLFNFFVLLDSQLWYTRW